MRKSLAVLLAAASAAVLAAPAAAQDSAAAPVEETAFDGDYLTVGIGAAYMPSYDGSDDYVFSPLPMLQGRLGGIGVSPRPAGLALDLIADSDATGPSFAFGPAVRLRTNRARQVKDPVVKLLPELDTALEIGPTAGVSFPAVLNPYDSLSFTLDARWDVAGAHGGMVVAPSASYSTPLSEGMAAVLSVSGEWADDKFMAYYHSVDAAAATATGLPQFEARGGLRQLGTQLLVGFDLDGDLRNGGAALFATGGYSRLFGDAKDSPFTAVRGSAGQWLAGAGIAYTF